MIVQKYFLQKHVVSVCSELQLFFQPNDDDDNEDSNNIHNWCGMNTA